jgi:hypothetical protein
MTVLTDILRFYKCIVNLLKLSTKCDIKCISELRSLHFLFFLFLRLLYSFRNIYVRVKKKLYICISVTLKIFKSLLYNLKYLKILVIEKIEIIKKWRGY